jgi:hypothetical protein
MDIVSWLSSQWAAISSAPATYLATALVVWIASAKFTRTKLGDESAAARERVEFFRQKLQDVEEDKSQLISKLQAHGEDLEGIKRDLASRPQIHVGSEAPSNPNYGDLWIDTSSPNSSIKRDA